MRLLMFETFTAEHAVYAGIGLVVGFAACALIVMISISKRIPVNRNDP